MSHAAVALDLDMLLRRQIALLRLVGYSFIRSTSSRGKERAKIAPATSGEKASRSGATSRVMMESSVSRVAVSMTVF